MPVAVIALFEVIDVDHDAGAGAEQKCQICDAVEVRIQRSAIEELGQRIERGFFSHFLQFVAQLANVLAELAEHPFLALGAFGHDLLHTSTMPSASARIASESLD